MTAAVLRLSARFGAHMALPPLSLRLETLLLLTALFLTLTANIPFWSAVMVEGTPAIVLALLCGLTALNFILLALVATRHTVRPVLSVLLPLSALAAYYISHYGIVIDPDMVRNALHTNVREARELIGVELLWALLPSVVVLALVWKVQTKTVTRQRAVTTRLLSLGAAMLIFALAIFSVFQDFSSLMRNHSKLRYLITPGNVVWSLGRVVVGDAKAATEARDPLEPVQRMVATGATSKKPLLVVMVVGETARAANFALNGYARQTNPQLAQLEVLNFPHTTACGTSTEVSVPCMFSPFGRSNYDEARIRRHESMPQLLQRGGVSVHWLDNQSGCKGVCDGLETSDLSHSEASDLCDSEHCFDEILLQGLKQSVATHTGDQFVVMHQLGNHGPAYSRRYPDAFKRFAPVCEHNDLGKCSQEEIVNAYDNAIVYTDHLLAQTIAYLQQQQDKYDVALIYVSDHGESLGEHGLFLHGMPYSIAPKEQTQVPLVWWLPPASAKGRGVDMQCLRDVAQAPASHDNLYHSVLGLLGVTTPRYQSGRDLFAGCRIG